MADDSTSPYLSKLPPQYLRASYPLIQQFLQNFSSDFLHKAICFSVVIVLLSLLPSQASEHQSFLARTWELLHLLFVGIAISYGLFSRRNLDFDAGKETPRAKAEDDSESYLSDMLLVPSVFDDGDDEFYVFQGALDETKTQTWNSRYRRNDPVVVFANEGAGRNLSLPVRSLKSHVPELDSGEEIMESSSDSSLESFGSQMVETEDEEVSSRGIVLPPSSSSFSLPSAFNGDSILPKTSSFRYSKTPSPKRPCFSPVMRAKSSEDLRNTKTLHEFSPPPAPPPPPPFAGHGNPGRKITQRRFKDELKDLSRMVRKGGQCNTDIVFDLFESAAKLNGFSAGISCRTFRPKDASGGADSEKKWGYEAHRPESSLSFQTEEKNESMEKQVASPAAVDSSTDTDEEEEEVEAEESSVKEEKVLQAATKVGANENEVDKKADEFIAKFRKQMTLQRFEAAKC